MTEDREVASCMVRLCVASMSCIWYDVDAKVPASNLSDLEMVYGLLNTDKPYRKYVEEALRLAHRYDDEARIKAYAYGMTHYVPE